MRLVPVENLNGYPKSHLLSAVGDLRYALTQPLFLILLTGDWSHPPYLAVTSHNPCPKLGRVIKKCPIVIKRLFPYLGIGVSEVHIKRGEGKNGKTTLLKEPASFNRRITFEIPEKLYTIETQTGESCSYLYKRYVTKDPCTNT
jgi:hypothetical protein